MTVGKLPPFELTKLLLQYAHFLSCDALPLTICYKLYSELLSPFLAQIAKGSPLACVKSHPIMSQWLLDEFEPRCWWSI